MFLFLLACWKNIQGEIPMEKAKEWNEPLFFHEAAFPYFTLDIRAGSGHDPIGKEGLAWITAHSLFSDDMRVKIDVGRERVRFQIPLIHGSEEQVLSKAAQHMTTPMWSGEAVDIAKKQWNKRSIEKQQDPEAFFSPLFLDWLYEGHPYGHDPMGTYGGHHNISIFDIYEFYTQYYDRSSIVLSWYGEKEKMERVEGFFYELESMPVMLPKYHTPKSIHKHTQTNIQLFSESSTSSWTAFFGFAIQEPSLVDRMAMMMMREYLCPESSADFHESFLLVYDPVLSCSYSTENSTITQKKLSAWFSLWNSLDNISMSRISALRLEVVKILREDPSVLHIVDKWFQIQTLEEIPSEELYRAFTKLKNHHPQVAFVFPETASRNLVEEYMDSIVPNVIGNMDHHTNIFSNKEN